MATRENRSLGDVFQSLAERSRQILQWALPGRASASASIEAIARVLMSSRGEASGVALARELIARWERLDAPARLHWFQTLARGFGPDETKLRAAAEAWLAQPSPANVLSLQEAAEPSRQELLRRINLAAAGTAAVVDMRAHLLRLLPEHPELGAADADFEHLLQAWFNRGFLALRHIDWSTPADILEKIIRHEAVHAIGDWEELKRRIQPRDRRCFAFFHPQMPDEPLIFVEVALTAGVPGTIGEVLREDREPLEPEAATAAVFYSISNTQAGLKGVSFGNFLIKQVVEDLLREFRRLETFATLSPVPGFASWLSREGEEGSRSLDALEQAAARYLVHAKDANGRPLDPVARFHLGNGARLERICPAADPSPRGLRQSHGIMVNYVYDLPQIERNHEAFANEGTVAMSAPVRKLARLIAGLTAT